MKKKNQPDQLQQSLLDALISDIIDGIPLEDRVKFANLSEDEVQVIEAVLAKFLNQRLEGLDEQVNDELLKECKERSGDNSLDDAGASGFILTELWERLRETLEDGKSICQEKMVA
jgi:hypothetical protein